MNQNDTFLSLEAVQWLDVWGPAAAYWCYAEVWNELYTKGFIDIDDIKIKNYDGPRT